MENKVIEGLGEITPIKVKKRRNFAIVYIISLPILVAILIMDKLFPEECVEKAQVVEIVSVAGVKATFKFSDGKTMQISHAHLRRGDNYCMATERQNKYFK